MRTLVVIPTYNEVENIAWIIDRTLTAAPDVEILVVDDNSPDGTADVVEALAEPRVRVLRRAAKAGLGPAYLAGFQHGLDNGFERLVEMDADGSHPPEELPRLLDRSRSADLVIGSRYVRGGAVRDWPRRRVMLSRWGNRYVQWMLGLPVRDATAGFRVFSDTALQRIGMEGIEASGYGFQINMTLRAREAGLVIAEEPITFVDRTRGTSKMSLGIVWEALWLTTRWAIARRGRR
jgi:dolichol-phosphate mannosyltransferase